jgi:hypothetical protein
MNNKLCRIFVEILLLSAGCVFGQSSPTSEQRAEPPLPATKMEAFKPAAGSVLTFGYDEVGRIGNVSVDVREMRDSKTARARGLTVQVTESQYRKEQSFVDADEIPELLKGFDALLAIKENPTQFKNFEVRYKTRGELELTVFNSGKGTINYSVKAGRMVGASTFLNAAEIQNLRALFVSASQKLATLPQ